jgi:protein TonB
MKLILLVGLISLTYTLFAQERTDSIQSSQVILVAETPPQYPGGNSELYKFVNEKLTYPKKARKKGIQGRVVIAFVVERDGTISADNITVEQSVDPLLDNESIRVVKLMPKWIPAYQKGRTVRCRMVIPFGFVLD